MVRRTFRSFPPGRGHLKIPTSSRRAARAGLALYAPCRPKGILVRWAAWRIVGVLGAYATPGRPTEWRPPVRDSVWADLTDVWRDEIGPFDGLAVYERPQASRSGFAALLLEAGDPRAFVKLRENEEAPLANEWQALGAISRSNPTLFLVPRPLASGNIGGWYFLMTTALSPGLHRMPHQPALSEILEDVRRGLSSLERPAGVPGTWEQMHGDFTPWNLRQRSDGSLFLIDWEDAGWSPAGSDEVLYRAVEAVFSGSAVKGDLPEDAVQFWRERLAIRVENGKLAGDADWRLASRLLAVLGTV